MAVAGFSVKPQEGRCLAAADPGPGRRRVRHDAWLSEAAALAGGRGAVRGIVADRPTGGFLDRLLGPDGRAWRQPCGYERSVERLA